MFFTQPPCKTLGIYHHRHDKGKIDKWARASSKLELLGRIHNPEGLRVNEFLSALEQYYPIVFHAWLYRAYRLREQVAWRHWIDDIWYVPGAPELVLLLDNCAMKAEEDGLEYGFHTSRRAYLAAERCRAERQGEWLPQELMEPVQTATSSYIT